MEEIGKYTEKRHILLCGAKQTGKSTLISRFIGSCARPVFGFITKMDPAGPDGFHEIYMYPAALKPEERVRRPENLIGRCNGREHEVHAEVFESLGTKLIREARPEGILVMDELGFMEAEIPAFTDAVLEALHGDIPVLAAVKERYDVPFLNAVRAAKKARCFTVNARTRETLYEKLKAQQPFRTK